MSRYYEIVPDLLEDGAVPVQYVGVYVLKWGKTAEPEVGFFGSSIGESDQGWRNAARVLKRQRDEVQAELDNLSPLHQAPRNVCPERDNALIALQDELTAE